jgi:hypothetical protein
MKIEVDGVELFTLSETHKKVIKNDILSGEFEKDMKRRIAYPVAHKYEQCFKRLKDEWDAKFEALGITSIPTNKDEYAELVFAQPTYKNMTDRVAEEALEK